MKTSWIKGLNDQDKLDLESSYKASTVLRRRLIELLKEKAELANKNARSKMTYDNPNWAYLQADKVGYERALHEIIELL